VLCGLVLQITGHSRKALFTFAVPDGIVGEHSLAERAVLATV
jgi:hypothetical protein